MTLHLGLGRAWIFAAIAIAGIGCDEAGQLEGGTGGGIAGNGGFVQSTPLPCEVGKVIADNCQGCHGATPLYGAPMPLMTWEDVTRAVTWQNANRPAGMAPNAVVGLEMHRRINQTPQTPMPPLTVVNQLDDQERAILNGWLAAPYQGQVGQFCGPQGGTGGVGATGGTGGILSTAGVGGMAGDVAAGTGGVGMAGTGGSGAVAGNSGTGGTAGTEDPTAPYIGVPPDCEDMYEFVAHGQETPNDPTAYPVSPSTGNSYQCFRFKVPWAGEQRQLVYSAPITGDARVLHHWILYAHDSATFADGQRDACAGAELGRYFIQGWAPGGEETALPRNVGLQLPSGQSSYFTLEVHYNNAAGVVGAADRSGVRICTTKTPREHTAAVHWLGTDSISIPAGGTANPSGDCRPNTQATILSVSPHMHKLGTHMSTIITRANGGTETLHDRPFQFDNQVSYSMRPPVVVGPGDVLRTTCSYTNTTNQTVSFGSATEAEMCYNFVTAYPVGSLAQGLGASANRCLGGLGL